MTKFKISTWLPVIFLILAVMVVYGISDAHATKPPKTPEPSMLQQQQQQMEQYQKQKQQQQQKTAVDVSTTVEATGGSANNEGVEQSVVVAGDMVAASTAYAAGAYTNMECGATASASTQEVSQGFSLSALIPWWGSRQIRDCWRRDDANWMDSMGLHLDAIESRCATRSMLIKYTTKEECYDKLTTNLKARHSLESDLATVTKERDTALTMYQQQSELADRHAKELADKRFVEAVSK